MPLTAFIRYNLIIIGLFYSWTSFGQCSVIVTGSNNTGCSVCNGTAAANPTGTPPFSYLWTPGNMTTQSVSSLCSGNYTLTVTDANSCIATQNFSIASSPTGTTFIGTFTNSSCFGSCDGTATMTPNSGTPPFTYYWSNSQTTQTITGLCSGVYTGFITDSLGCVSNGWIFNISQPLQIQTSFSITNASCSTCCDGNVTANLSGGTPPYSYLWCNGMTTQTASGLCPGCCYFSVTDANGCTETDSACIGFPFGQIEIASSMAFSVYPIPANDILFIQIKNAPVLATIYNSLGKVIISKQLTSKLSEINISYLKYGVYFIVLESVNVTTRQKIIKTNH